MTSTATNDTTCFVSWEDALNGLADSDPEALDNFYAFDQGNNSPFEIYGNICTLDIDINQFLDSLFVSVEKCAGRELDDFDMNYEGFILY